MNIDDAKIFLQNRWKNARVLRKEFPELTDWLQGEFNDEFHLYELPSGIVVSRDLARGLEKDPTLGLITPGEHEFKLGKYTENFIALDGRVIARVDSDKPTPLTKGGNIIAPSNSTLYLTARGNAFYVCHYT